MSYSNYKWRFFDNIKGYEDIVKKHSPIAFYFMWNSVILEEVLSKYRNVIKHAASTTQLLSSEIR